HPAALTGKQLISLFAKEMNAPDKVSVLPGWLIKAIGLFVPIMKEMPEMMYQYDRDYVFNSTKFDRRFDFKTTTYPDGIKETVEKSIM
ncbi:MAG: NAD-dependent dehydratase, partial [Opitutaceae bacterium]|nr:NAD-dependent dehydratase [Cytophagales bacterium]